MELPSRARRRGRFAATAPRARPDRAGASSRVVHWREPGFTIAGVSPRPMALRLDRHIAHHLADRSTEPGILTLIQEATADYP
jgi:hypothetical protein